MFKSKLYSKIFFLVTLFSLFSCSQQKQVAYYQDLKNGSNLNDSFNFESRIQPDDLLMIYVSTPDSEAAAPFNLESTLVPSAIGQANTAQRQQQLYLVDNKGIVNFPVLGELKISGLTKTELITTLKSKLKNYVKDAMVTVRIMNFKVTVQGEVNKPGSYSISGERITLPEAIGLAGDMTIYGRRNNVIVIRETDGKKAFQRIDMTNSEFINSPYYYLIQNDMVYVEPNEAKSNTASVFNQNIPVWISIASLVSSAVFSIILINKK
jgi:polysaccharide biosynthesis/export protein